MLALLEDNFFGCEAEEVFLPLFVLFALIRVEITMNSEWNYPAVYPRVED